MSHRIARILVALLASLAAVQVVRGGGEDCDACKFDGTDDGDCLVYGKFKGELVAWSFGTQECRDEYDIKISSIDPSLVCASPNSFVNALRFGDLSMSTAKLGLGASEGFFFTQDNSGNPVLKDEITIDGVTYDCEASESNCYNAMKPYFGKEPGKTEMQQVCDTLYDTVALNREEEQFVLRIRICMEINDGTTMPSVCDPLWSEVQAKLTEDPSTSCPSFGFGPGTTPIPGCEGGSGGNPETSGARKIYSVLWMAASVSTGLFVTVVF